MVTFCALRESSLIPLVDALNAEVGYLQHPPAVDHAIGGLEVAVDFHGTPVQISHSLQNAYSIHLRLEICKSFA